MKFINCEKDEFKKLIKNRKVICIGASKNVQSKYDENIKWFDEWKKNIAYFIDNNESKWYKKYEFGKDSYIVYPLERLHEINDSVILIMTHKKHILDICKQLESMNLPEMEVLSLEMIFSKLTFDDSAISFPCNKGLVNNKVIHTFWFSGDSIPEHYQVCIESWKKYCPDYEIKIWNKNNYDVTQSRFMEEAFMAQKWAFVSDYARLDVIYRYGGIYMDMDVEVVRNLDDLLTLPCFFGIDPWNQIDLGTGFGAASGNVLVGQLLDEYKDKVFFLNNGYNIEAQPLVLLDVFKRNGYVEKSNSQQCGDVYFLSMNYLNVFEGTKINKYHSTGNEYLIHHHAAGWWTQEKRQARYDSCYRDSEILENIFQYVDVE